MEKVLNLIVMFVISMLIMTGYSLAQNKQEKMENQKMKQNTMQSDTMMNSNNMEMDSTFGACAKALQFIR